MFDTTALNFNEISESVPRKTWNIQLMCSGY